MARPGAVRLTADRVKQILEQHRACRSVREVQAAQAVAKAAVEEFVLQLVGLEEK